MKSMISKTMVLLALCTTAFSFSPKPGGEGFEIFLNNKVILQQYGSDMNKVQSLQLNQVSSTDQLTIRYFHCGRVGKNRIITFKDGQNNVIKEFHFADVNNADAAMTLNVKDILSLKKRATALKLYYSSSELPAGRMLVSINTGTANTTLP